MTANDAIRVVPASPELAQPLVRLFAASDVSCHCRYWHFQDSTNAWLDRSVHAPDVNRDEMLSALERRTDEMSGVVAVAGENAVGWLKLAPAPLLTKLYSQRPYRRLTCFDEPRENVFTVGCLLVVPEHRHRGIATLLLDGAIEYAKSRGARAVEAFPRRADSMRDEEAWMGAFSMFQRAGFVVVNDFAPYPVLRLTLTPRRR